MTKLSVSVIVPIYNGARYLDEQLRSIITQLSDIDELILINDASTDDSEKVIELYQKFHNVISYENGHNVGLSASINKGLRIASGEIIVFADQDDVWLPGRVALIKSEHLYADCVVVDALVCDENLGVKAESYFDMVGFSLGLISMFARCRVLGCCMSFRRKLVRGIKIPERCWHDHFLILLFMITRAKISALNVPMIKYRRHELALSAAGRENTTAINPYAIMLKVFRTVCNRMVLIWCIINTILKLLLVGRIMK